jgi:hypothetical protein
LGAAAATDRSTSNRLDQTSAPKFGRLDAFPKNLCSSAQSADAKLFPAGENISRNESGARNGSAAEVTLEKLGIEHHIAQAL